MLAFGRKDSRQAWFRCAHAGLALALVAAAPLAFGQKMYRCSDGKGGTTFQQSPCPETAAEADARAKEKERLLAEEARKKEEAARRKEEQLQKARDRDKAYQELEKQRAEERKRAEAAERKILEGAGQGAAPAAAAPAAASATATAKDDLPPDLAESYPGPWRPDSNPLIAKALATNQIKNCGAMSTRQRAGGSKEFIVKCGTSGAYFVVLPEIGGVRPVRF
jgi:hypothetical protein